MIPIDNRLVCMAQVLIRYSLNVQPSNLVAIQGGTGVIPLLREVYRELLRAGGYPKLMLDLEDVCEIYLKEANDSQLNFVSPITQLNGPLLSRIRCLNDSALHWEMVCDLRQQGKVRIDGE